MINLTSAMGKFKKKHGRYFLSCFYPILDNSSDISYNMIYQLFRDGQT